MRNKKSHRNAKGGGFLEPVSVFKGVHASACLFLKEFCSFLFKHFAIRGDRRIAVYML
jgi:hypothetical protein